MTEYTIIDLLFEFNSVRITTYVHLRVTYYQGM